MRLGQPLTTWLFCDNLLLRLDNPQFLIVVVRHLIIPAKMPEEEKQMSSEAHPLCHALARNIRAAGGDPKAILGRLQEDDFQREKMARLLVAWSVRDSSGECTLWLQRGPDVIRRLITDGGYWEGIHSIPVDRYPVDGVVGKDVLVRFRLFPGDKIPHAGHPDISRADVKEHFHRERVQFPDAAEALLPPARDPRLGCDGSSLYVAFVRDSLDTLVVGSDSAGHRCLKFRSDDGSSRWFSANIFVGVQLDSAA